MSKLEELINKLCPNGVEFISLETLFKQFSGMTGVSNKWKEIGNCKFIDYMNAYKNLKIDVSRLENATVKKLEQNKLAKGDILLTSASETPDECALSSVIEKDIIENVFMDDHLFGIRLKDEYKTTINTSYINYYMHTNQFRKDVFKAVRGVTRFYISVDTFMKIKVAVPPLEVQCEIVRILDNFTLLSAELSAELSARQKQYEYYAEKLLFNNEYEKVKLGDLCVVNQGLQIPINQRKKEPGQNRYFYITVQFLKGGDENYYIENPQRNVICNKEDILVTRTGSTGKIITGVEGCFHNNFFKVEPNEKVLKRYLYFVLNSKTMYNKMLSSASGGTVPDLPHKKFYNLEIFLPNIEEQKRIINILEKLYKISNDISNGLPAEIEARKKQYEFYRDKLLTFKELKDNE
ncbi:restriction endonuclease subunit S [Campylobacter sp. P0109]|uniref:restriction endonuclease subunit S n=1 Tax=Campylobacter sp. P0109 TaxID=1895606 RepID=UPI000A33839C|nr:restriction endonuclease subunit S [Campylobacter sp. P0109]